MASQQVPRARPSPAPPQPRAVALDAYVPVFRRDESGSWFVLGVNGWQPSPGPPPGGGYTLWPW